jgi:succinate-semialdehyde dehydrogenase/glutarate-semialdehyde dehydrogenase
MELGGNAPFIVFDDADLETAVKATLASKYRNAGQTCVCANRILVQDTVMEEFSGMLADAVTGFKLGNGADEGVTMGPLIDDAAADNVVAMIEDATAGGAKVVLGGGRSALGNRFVEPTIIAGVTTDMRVFREEIFGPVAPLVSFGTEEEAIAMANDTEFGLAAYFCSRDVGRIWRVAEGLDFGIVGINEGVISNAMAPFGGMKESGNGREGSKYGLDDYLEIKYLCIGGIDR